MANSKLIAEIAWFLPNLGLSLQCLGAAIAARAVIITPEQADELSGTYWDQNLKLRTALLAQSKAAKHGLQLIALGAVVSLIAPLF